MSPSSREYTSFSRLDLERNLERISEEFATTPEFNQLPLRTRAMIHVHLLGVNDELGEVGGYKNLKQVRVMSVPELPDTSYRLEFTPVLPVDMFHARQLLEARQKAEEQRRERERKAFERARKRANSPQERFKRSPEGQRQAQLLKERLGAARKGQPVKRIDLTDQVPDRMVKAQKLGLGGLLSVVGAITGKSPLEVLDEAVEEAVLGQPQGPVSKRNVDGQKLTNWLAQQG